VIEADKFHQQMLDILHSEDSWGTDTRYHQTPHLTPYNNLIHKQL
jgi:hypothetical protein